MHGICEGKSTNVLLEKWVQEAFPEAYVLNCEVGNGFMDSIFLDLNSQIEDFSNCVNNDPNLKDGFIGVGFSQGGMLLRAYIERYNHVRARMLRFIGVSAPLGGFFCGRESNCFVVPGLPISLNDWVAENVYTEQYQDWIGATSYWRDPFNLD